MQLSPWAINRVLERTLPFHSVVFFFLVPLLLKIPLWKYSEAVREQRKESCLFWLEPFGGGSHNTANTLLASLRLGKSIHNTLRCLKEGLVFVPEFSTL